MRYTFLIVFVLLVHSLFAQAVSPDMRPEWQAALANAPDEALRLEDSDEIYAQVHNLTSGLDPDLRDDVSNIYYYILMLLSNNTYFDMDPIKFNNEQFLGELRVDWPFPGKSSNLQEFISNRRKASGASFYWVLWDPGQSSVKVEDILSEESNVHERLRQKVREELPSLWQKRDDLSIIVLRFSVYPIYGESDWQEFRLLYDHVEKQLHFYDSVAGSRFLIATVKPGESLADKFPSELAAAAAKLRQENTAADSGLSSNSDPPSLIFYGLIALAALLIVSASILYFIKK